MERAPNTANAAARASRGRIRRVIDASFSEQRSRLGTIQCPAPLSKGTSPLLTLEVPFRSTGSPAGRTHPGQPSACFASPLPGVEVLRQEDPGVLDGAGDLPVRVSLAREVIGEVDVTGAEETLLTQR